MEIYSFFGLLVQKIVSYSGFFLLFVQNFHVSNFLKRVCNLLGYNYNYFKVLQATYVFLISDVTV